MFLAGAISTRTWLQLARNLRAARGGLRRMEHSQRNKIQVNVDITSDVVCPWCWVGKRHFDAAVQRLANDFDFHVRWKPFLLNPYMPDEGVPLEEYIVRKFGEEAGRRFLSKQSPVAQQGQAVGITFNANRLVVPTKKAHILLDYAAKEDKQHELQEVLFRSYFTDGKNISSDEVLRELLSEVGLNVKKAMAYMRDSEAVEEYEEGVREAQRKGITGVPHFEIYVRDKPSMRQLISGAQPTDTIVSVFNRLQMLAKV